MEEAQVVLSSRVGGRESSSFVSRHLLLHKYHHRQVSSCHGKFGVGVWGLRTPFLGLRLRELVHQGSFLPFSSIRFLLLSFRILLTLGLLGLLGIPMERIG